MQNKNIKPLTIYNKCFKFLIKKFLKMLSNWEDFYAKNPPPADLTKKECLFKEFTDWHMKNNNRVVLVTVSLVIT